MCVDLLAIYLTLMTPPSQKKTTTNKNEWNEWNQGFIFKSLIKYNESKMRRVKTNLEKK